MSDLQDKMKKDMFAAVKEHNSEISGIIQLTLSSLKNAQIEKGEDLTEEEEIDIVRKESKKLQDSIDQFSEAGRSDLVDPAVRQKEYIDSYLPKLMNEDEVEAVVKGIIDDMGASSMSDLGKVMGASMGQLKGKADGALVKDAAMKLLS